MTGKDMISGPCESIFYCDFGIPIPVPVRRRYMSIAFLIFVLALVVLAATYYPATAIPGSRSERRWVLAFWWVAMTFGALASFGALLLLAK